MVTKSERRAGLLTKLLESIELPLKITLELISRSKCYEASSVSYIERIPNEILVKIFQHCDDNDFANLRLQCKRFDQVQ